MTMLQVALPNVKDRERQPDSTSKPSGKIKKAVFSLLAFAGFFAFSEIALRVLGVCSGWEFDAPALREQLDAHAGRPGLWSDKDLLEASFSLYEDHGTLLWRIRPNLSLNAQNFLLPPGTGNKRAFRLETNCHGFRGAEQAVPGSIVVLCLGDSNTFGWGLDEGLTYPDRLQDELDKARPGEFSVLNRAQPGYSSEQGLALWMSRGFAACPGHVVIGFGFNDGVRSHVTDSEAMRKRGGAIGSLRGALTPSRTFRLVSRLSARAVKSAAPAAALKARVAPDAYVSNLESLAALARAAGARPVFLSIRNKYPGQAADAAFAAGVRLVDADALAAAEFEALRSGGGDARWRAAASERFGADKLASNPRWWVDADVAHYNERVHELLARELADAILGAR